MKIAVSFRTPEGEFTFSHPFEDVEGFQPAVAGFILTSIPGGSRISSAIAFGYAWGAYINGITDADNPLALSATCEDCRCMTQVCDPDLEAAFGVTRS